MGSKVPRIAATAIFILVILLSLLMPSEQPHHIPLISTPPLKELPRKPYPQDKHPLRYKAPIKADNPLFTLYQDTAPRDTPSKPHTKTQHTQDPPGFLSAYNTDHHTHIPFFTAISPKQPLQNAKPIQILLKEPINALDLPAGTLLKGVPAIEKARIKITITASIVHGKVRPLQLFCFDPNDCLEGLFNDQRPALAWN